METWTQHIHIGLENKETQQESLVLNRFEEVIRFTKNELSAFRFVL